MEENQEIKQEENQEENQEIKQEVKQEVKPVRYIPVFEVLLGNAAMFSAINLDTEKFECGYRTLKITEEKNDI